MFGCDRFWAIDPLPMSAPQAHPGFLAPHPLKCARVGCCRPIAFLTTDRRMPYLGFCATHKTHLTNVPVLVAKDFSDWPRGVQAVVDGERAERAAMRVAMETRYQRRTG